MTADQAATLLEPAEIMGALYGPGFASVRGAFTRDWVADLAEDVAVQYEEALARPGGAVGRGRNRHYVEIHPEAVRGFADLVSHPWLTAVCEAVLGPGYVFVEIGFDVPNPGAIDQPWHRDFAAPPETLVGRRLSSIAFNLTTVDVEPTMGPFEIAPGTQWDDGAEFDHGMFPPKDLYGRYQDRAERKLPQRGDVSVRTALTVHRGTANTSDTSRPVLVLGVEAADATKAIPHDLQMTRAFFDTLPVAVHPHLSCRLVDELEPIVQGHTIEGLVMGEA
jgi:ectoine hydroxylase-related dioxygenase (phytanoyl-CoA dioxygenase family)